MNTDVFLLQTASGGFEYISAGIDSAGDETVSLYQVKMNSHYYNREDKSIVSPYAQASNDCPASE